MSTARKALLLVNVGTPDKPRTWDVAKYLSQFLNDKRVMDIPWLLRKILVNLIIVPFRSPKSARLYRRLWTPEGSPLLISLQKLTANLNNDPAFPYDVYGAMRYGNPSVKSILKEMEAKKYEEIVLLPLFPQYASSTTETAVEEFYKQIRRWNTIPSVKVIGQFYDHPAFIRAFASRIRQYDLEQFDYVLFSYHGLPVRHIEKCHPHVGLHECTCHLSIPEYGTYCYRATCYETTRLLAKEIPLKEDSYSVSFQSRLTKRWLEPFTDKTLINLAQSGKKNVLVVAPSFVSDCLETIIELADENAKIFRQHGGEKLVLVASLNEEVEWVKEVIIKPNESQ